MKIKFLALLLLMAIFTTMLCSCEIIKLANNILKFIPGNDSNNGDTNININIGGTTAHVHIEGVIPAVESTCTAHGLTEGRICLSCNEIIVPQEEAPFKAHSFDDDRDATCNNCDFVRDITCYHTHIEFLESKNSTCTETGLTEGRKCEDCGLILVAQEVVALKNHTAGDWIVDKPATTTEEGHKYLTCIICKQIIEESAIPIIKEPSVGLEYTLNSDKKSYSVTGIGTCKDTYIVIGDTYNDKPVTMIGEKAFYQNQSIVGIFISKNVEEIAYTAFYGCNKLAKVEFAIDSNLKSISGSCFSSCTSLTNIVLPSTVIEIEGYSFSSCSSITSINIPVGITTFNDRAFDNCNALDYVYYEGTLEQWLSIKTAGYLEGYYGNPLSNGANLYINNELVTDVIVPENITSISKCAFQGCFSINSITIPTSVTSIGKYAFMNAKNLVIINYLGTIEQWKSIEKGNYWDLYTGEYIVYCTDGQITKDGTVTYN